jgi:protein SERAC1
LAYSESRHASNIAHLHSIYTCTFAILFFGTPHHGSSKARLLGSLQKLASLAVPKRAVQIESSLVNALEEESETLQNITDQFAPLMANFRVFFFWEQEKTDLKYAKEYIVDEASAAPILDNTERCGIAADHRGMCKFESGSAQGFRTVVAALRRYSQEAPQIIRGRWIKTTEMLTENQRHKAMEILRGAQEWPADAFPPETVHRIEDPFPRRGILD